MRKTKGTHAVRVILFYPSMFRLPSRAVAPARRKRTATVSLFASTQMFCGPAWRGQKAARYTSPCGRRTDAGLGHGVVAIHSGSYWIINTLGMEGYN
ncbi:hypothetical protein AM501_24770 [Aneurinibacillus migulanus]|nr:hypothetical protein TS64_21940 [Aneurinibacillus migulanus]KPD05710.1 hypothetical protein AM501_24770 [Aneurinibacillus migulanus]